MAANCVNNVAQLKMIAAFSNSIDFITDSTPFMLSHQAN
jgi:hypothetical protein